MTSSSDLFQLMEIDLRRDSRRAMIADIEARLGETDALIAAREAAEEAQEELKDIQAAQRRLEARLQDLDAKIQPLERKLYDGSVRNPKELTDMQKELALFKKQRGGLDDQGLELIEAIEEGSQALSQAQETLKQSESAWRDDQASLAADKKVAEADYVRLEGDRGARTADMDRSMLGLYEALRAKKAGRAVARVERSVCQGCRITLPSHVVQRLRTGLLVQCPSCERILVAG